MVLEDQTNGLVMLTNACNNGWLQQIKNLQGGSVKYYY